LDGRVTIVYGPHLVAQYTAEGQALAVAKKPRGPRCGNDAPWKAWKSQKADSHSFHRAWNGESADVVWRQIQAEEGKMVAPTSFTPEPLPSIDEGLPPAPPPAPVLSVPIAVNALKFGSRPPSPCPARRRGPPPTAVQFSLFRAGAEDRTS
jgi:hypothetical protein